MITAVSLVPEGNSDGRRGHRELGSEFTQLSIAEAEEGAISIPAGDSGECNNKRSEAKPFTKGRLVA